METPYLYLSILVGIAQTLDAGYLTRLDGKLSSFAINFSLFEYVWAGISIWVASSMVNVDVFPNWYPWSYVGYIAVAMVVSIGVYKNIDPSNIQIPGILLAIGGFFGLFFAGTGTYFALQ